MRHLKLWGGLVLLLGACQPTATTSHSEAIRIRWTRDPETLDPLALPNQNAIDAANLLHLGLLQVDFQTQQYAPALAQTLPGVQLLGDSLTLLDYHLRPSAAWDDGRPVLATDVDFTLKLLHCPGLPNESARAQFGFIRQLRADPTDARHFTLVCRGQAPEYLTASGDFPILPEAALDPAHTLRRWPLATLQSWPATQAPAPAVAALAQRYQLANLARHPERLPGCGAYRLATWEPNRHLLFRRKAPWWADGLRPAPFVLQARPAALDFSIVPDDAAATLALRRRELDVYPQVSARAFERLRASAPAQRELVFYTGDSYDVMLAGFNTRRPALRDRRTRQALGRLFDAAGLLAATQLGQGHRTVGLLPPGSPFYNDSLPLLPFAPVQAVAWLRQAGWQHRADSAWYQPGQASALTLALRYRADEAAFATAALQFRAAAARLGIAVALRPTEPLALTRALQAGDFDVYIRTLRGSPFGYNFAPLLHSAAVSSGNFSGFSSALADRLLTAIPAEGNAHRKRLMLWHLQTLLREEMPLVPLFFLPYRLAASRQLRPLTVTGLKPGYAALALAWAPADSLSARAR